MTPDLCIGITTWNSATFLPACLDGVRKTTDGLRVQLEVVDNLSRDGSAEIAVQYGAHVRRVGCGQSRALNMLLRASQAPYTLLMHSDVVLLSREWVQACTAKLSGTTALVSPEDVGCGPMTRPYGRGKPESSFLLFATSKIRRCLEWKLNKRYRIVWPQRELNLDASHVTHSLPDTLARHGYSWQYMKVHVSPDVSLGDVYVPDFIPEYWDERLGHLRYAMGNFYSLDGVVTHYHNWYDRVRKDVPANSRATTEGGGRGLPVAFLSAGTRRFLGDLAAGRLHLPDVGLPMPEPRETTRHNPDTGRAWPPAEKSGVV